MAVVLARQSAATAVGWRCPYVSTVENPLFLSFVQLVFLWHANARRARQASPSLSQSLAFLPHGPNLALSWLWAACGLPHYNATRDAFGDEVQNSNLTGRKVTGIDLVDEYEIHICIPKSFFDVTETKKKVEGSLSNFVTFSTWLVSLVNRQCSIIRNSKPHFFYKRDTLQYFGSLRSRELDQAPMLLCSFSTRQTLSSHKSQCLCLAKVFLSHRSQAGNEHGLGALQHSLWPNIHSIHLAVGTKAFLFMIFVGVHDRLTHFSSCRHQGSNCWPLDYKSNTLILYPSIENSTTCITILCSFY